jgi:signal transduction histidine kinase
VASYIARLSLMAGASVLGAIVISLLVSSLLTRPLARLARAARQVGSGDLSTKVHVNGRDEMGDVARAFNSMTDALNQSQESLIQRNLELGILNSMADTLSRQMTQEQVLDVALYRLLELTQFRAAWVCARDPQGRTSLAAHRGLPTRAAGGTPAAKDRRECGCNVVFRTGKASVLEAASSCPLVASDEIRQIARGGLAVVPLWSQDRVAAVLCIISEEPGAFDEGRLRLLPSIGQQMGIALQNATLYHELEVKEKMRAGLLDKLIGAQEEERKRIARELHDEPVQELTAVMLQVDKVEQRLASHHEEQQEVERVKQGARAAMESLHRILTELRPQALDDLGLLPAIRWYAQQRLVEVGVRLDLEAVGKADRLPPPIEVGVFRITQEAINNVARHAKADHVSIRMRFDSTAVSGEIEDNGKGFDTGAVPLVSPSNQKGLGLLGMVERAELLGGTLTIKSSVGRGTLVSFHIPLSQTGVGDE